METKKLKVMRGSKEHPELVEEWLIKSQGAIDRNEIHGCIYNDFYYFVVDGIIQHVRISNWIWNFIDHEVVELKPKHVFQPFDKVLVRDTPEFSNYHRWEIAFFGRIDEENDKYVVIGGGAWDECIPYEGNAHLLGTTDSPKEGGDR